MQSTSSFVRQCMTVLDNIKISNKENFGQMNHGQSFNISRNKADVTNSVNTV